MHPAEAADARSLSAAALACRRGGRTLFSGLDVELRPGRVLELRGANGSGKSSLLRVLAGLAPAAGGELQWRGRAVRPGDVVYAREMAYLGHQNGLSAELSATENLRFSLQLGGGEYTEAARPAAALQAWGLTAQASQPVRRLSQGQRRRLALARVWLARRALWLLDEPCAALDAQSVLLFDTRLAEHLAEGGMAVVATHRPLAVAAAALQRLDLDALPRRRAGPHPAGTQAAGWPADADAGAFAGRPAAQAADRATAAC